MPSEEIREPEQLGLFDEPVKPEPVTEAVETPSPGKTAVEAPARSYAEDGTFELPPNF